jgi:ferric enterobactin receptor
MISLGSNVFCQQQTQKTLKKNTLDKFISRPLDDLLDTLSANYGLRIVFERDSVHRFDVVEHFFNEPLNKVLDKVCSQFDLNYWVDAGGTIYILQNVDDMARLKVLALTLKPIPRAKRDTIIADTSDEQDVEAIFDNSNKPKTKPKIQPAVIRVIPAKAEEVHLLVTITGRIVDQNSGAALPSATVRISKTDLFATTNSDGNFTIFRVPSDTCTLEVSYSGYEADHFKLNAEKLSRPLVLGMYPALNTLNEVNILGQKNGVMNTDVKKVGVLQLSPANLDKLPSLGEKDVMRAFQLMPGVGATNESSSGAYVRGGTPDQNLVVFDGFTIYEVDHLYGFFSAFNSNAIKDVQLFKGGFSAQYGGRLSSVTEINGKDGNKNEANFGVDLSLLSLNAFMETPVNDQSSLMVAIRRSYQGPFYNKIFKQFNTSTAGGFGGGPGGPGRPGGGFGVQTTPASHFYDADLRYTYHLDPNNILSWSFYSGSDKTDNSRQLQLPSFLGSGSAPNITDYTTYGNLGTSLKWFSQWNKEIHSNTYITYSSYFNDRNRTTSGTTTDSNGNQTSFSNGTVETNNLKDIGLKSEWEWQLNNQLKLLYGGFASRQHINYDYLQNDTSHLISQHNTALSGGGYTELEFDPNNKLHLQPGIRTTFYQPTGKLYLEPRFSASYVLSDNYTLKAATGQFHQFMNEVTRYDIVNGNRNFWVLSNGTSIPIGLSRHLMGGISYENDQFLVDVEGYYKWLTGLTQYTVIQTGLGPGGGTPGIQENFYSGTGKAKGIEILLQKKLGRYTGWLSYTLADAQNKFAVYGNSYYPADQDIRHEFKAINMYHYNRWNFSAVFIFSTGHPYTAPLSTYSITNADGTRTTYFNVSGKNAERLPDYHRLDLSATYDLLKISGNKIGSIGFSLFNVYNHVNTWYREYYLQNNAAVATDINYLGFTPNITLSLRWK